MLWVKLENEESRNKAIEAMNGLGEPGLRAGPDRALNERVVGGFLLGLKRQLVTWDYKPWEVRVNLEISPASMKVGGKDIMTAGVAGKKLEVKWVDQTWASWTDLVESREYNELVATAEGKLTKGGKGNGKGGKKGGRE